MGSDFRIKASIWLVRIETPIRIGICKTDANYRGTKRFRHKGRDAVAGGLAALRPAYPSKLCHREHGLVLASEPPQLAGSRPAGAAKFVQSSECERAPGIAPDVRVWLGVSSSQLMPGGFSMRKSLILAAGIAIGISTAFAQVPPTKVGDSEKGKVLTDQKGMTLYTFDRDSDGKSVCNGPCATNWPPLMAPAGAKADGSYTVIKRDDGSAQWAYKGKPLYGWVKDAKPGDGPGDGVNNVWRVATP
jgi:predicted lipoprotein with Yx(FWY)xxD motif